MPVDSAKLLKGLKPLLKALEKDLLERARDPGVDGGLKVAWQAEKDASRTGDAFPTWRRRRVTQVAVAWILSCVFVRTLEDRDFLDRRRLAGPGAEDSEALFAELAPFLTARDYLLTVFGELAELPGASAVFDARHNPVWVLAPSADACRRLLDFFRKPSKITKKLTLDPPSFDGTDTRFLGDLYQKLSEDVRKRYALLQTPEFVEEFILEQTLDPAVDAFGLAEVTLIDPTCGSGHFLLGAFRSLLEKWTLAEPTTPRIELARRALGQVFGADLNPYAVAIARFRLTLAFMHAVGISRISQVPSLPVNLCVADSLLHGVKGQTLRLSGVAHGGRGWGEGLFALEDYGEALRILGRRFHAVVGNPPYITEKDRAKRDAYRQLYASAAGKYALSAPFTERFFGLACESGFVGLINSNAFVKRDFGQTLIQRVLPQWTISKVIDTAGAYIPGHGTPTLLLFGKKEPSPLQPIPAVLGKRGETREPADAARAPVWRAITDHHNEVGYEGRYISTESIPAAEMAEHPWILSGGGARSVFRLLEGDRAKLESSVASIGFASFSGEDGAFLAPAGVLHRRGVATHYVRRLVAGSCIRDWLIRTSKEALCPYDRLTHQRVDQIDRCLESYLWRNRTILSATKGFGGKSRVAGGLAWWEWYRWISRRYCGPRPIVCAYVATHNQFSFGSPGEVYRGGASVNVITVREMSPADAQTLLAYLNSSTVGFWCRLVMFPKGGDQMGDGGRVSAAPWNRHLEYAGNLLKKLPVPDLDAARPELLALVQHIEAHVAQLQAQAPAKAIEAALSAGATTGAQLHAAQQATTAELLRLHHHMVSLQEEIDWRVYGLFGLPTLTAPDDQVDVPVRPEHRPFEVRLARDIDDDISASEWFRIHKRPPPADVGGPLAELYRRRLRLIEQHKELQLLETPETKRRWSPRDYKKEFRAATRDWLLDRVERVFIDADQTEALSARALAQALRRDPSVQAVAEAYTGESAPDLSALFSELVQDEAVPYLAPLRYKESGLEKYRIWQQTWELQRREDAGETVSIDKPPEYGTKDFRGGVWRHRGKLDVPKERFVAYLGAGSEGDDTPLVGWAGWDHLQKAQALAAIYQARKTDEGWTADSLTPLLAGLHELVPWLLQWHNEPSDAFGGMRLGDYFQSFLSAELRLWGRSEQDLRDWRPA